MMMMDPPRGESSIFRSTEMPTAPLPHRGAATRIALPPAATPPADDVVRTPITDREKKTPPVALHRQTAPASSATGATAGPVRETISTCKRACQGAAYDLKHWKGLPAKTFSGKAKIVATRGGRLPYLVLTVAIAFLVFFAVIHCVRWAGGRGRARGPTVYSYTNAPANVPANAPAGNAVTGGALPPALAGGGNVFLPPTGGIRVGPAHVV